MASWKILPKKVNRISDYYTLQSVSRKCVFFLSNWKLPLFQSLTIPFFQLSFRTLGWNLLLLSRLKTTRIFWSSFSISWTMTTDLQNEWEKLSERAGNCEKPFISCHLASVVKWTLSRVSRNPKSQTEVWRTLMHSKYQMTQLFKGITHWTTGERLIGLVL